jgi:hypothetical protein
MCTAIALAWSVIPTELKRQAALRRRVHHRDGKRELWFFCDDRSPKLPIRRDGQFQLARWGNGRRQSRHLPPTGWTWLSTVEGGYWSHIGGIFVDIPATFAYDRGVWVHIRQGIRGILVPDERGNAVCYMVCEPASHYYRIMTKSDRMPVLIGERI